jgi:argininosuccinate lyase
VGLEIEAGNFRPDKDIQHTHEGSIGNLCNDEIKAYKNDILKQFNFEKVQTAERELVE